ncbi:hypothetical protein PV327_004060 [Microctonus hyperodae]|uniref:Uncharacterized protein n=1 Tax=Microctonus hyperodae TaxID=165561 RepID=A0AA39FBS8_MICHY|nr:hypothetical protein PV327_004060 [Microctonus hyperodae]
MATPHVDPVSTDANNSEKTVTVNIEELLSTPVTTSKDPEVINIIKELNIEIAKCAAQPVRPVIKSRYANRRDKWLMPELGDSSSGDPTAISTPRVRSKVQIRSYTGTVNNALRDSSPTPAITIGAQIATITSTETNSSKLQKPRITSDEILPVKISLQRYRQRAKEAQSTIKRVKLCEPSVNVNKIKRKDTRTTGKAKPKVVSTKAPAKPKAKKTPTKVTTKQPVQTPTKITTKQPVETTTNKDAKHTTKRIQTANPWANAYRIPLIATPVATTTSASVPAEVHTKIPQPVIATPSVINNVTRVPEASHETKNNKDVPVITIDEETNDSSTSTIKMVSPETSVERNTQVEPPFGREPNVEEPWSIKRSPPVKSQSNPESACMRVKRRERRIKHCLP